MKRIVFIFLTFFFAFFITITTLAAELDLPKVAINPDRYFLYSLKRVMEKGLLLTKFNKGSKAEYLNSLMTVRMAELKYVVENKFLGEVEKSSQRLSYQVGILTDFLINNKTDLDNTIPDTKELLGNYKILLADLRDDYPANSSYWMLVQQTIDSIDLNLEKLR